MSHVMRASLLISLLLFFSPLLSFSAFAQEKEENTTTQSIEEKPAGSSENSKPEKKGKKSNADVKEEMSQSLDEELDSTGNPLASSKKQTNWAWQILRTTITLFVMLGILYVIYRLYMFRKTMPRFQSNAVRQHLDYPLSTNSSLQILEVGNRLLILGVTDSNINLISEVTEKSQIDQIKLDCENDRGNEKPDFILSLSSALRNQLKSFSSKNFSPPPVREDDSFSGMRRDSLSALERMKRERNNLNGGDDL